MPEDVLLHAAFDSRGDVALWLFFLIPCLVMAIGGPLIYRTSRWGGTRRPVRPSRDRGEAVGYLGNLVVGVGWLLAAALDHLGEALFDRPYRAGLVSKALEVGIMLAGLALASVSLLA